MSDRNSDDQIDKSDDHSEASLVPQSKELVSKADSAQKPKKAAQAPKEIVLQRLTPHSSWDDPAFKNGPAADKPFGENVSATPEMPSKRTLSLAAIVTIAAAVGAVGGSGTTLGVGHFMSGHEKIAAATEQGRTLESAIAKVNAEIAALKTAAATQATKLTKLNETTDKLRAAESTGAIAAPTPSLATAPAIPRLPIVSGWVLRDLGEGAARVQGPHGIFEVYPGDPLPGIGRVDAIRKQDGRWVVVTTRGLIVAR